MVTKVIKKNGMLNDCNGEKVKVAIRKSAERAMVELTSVEEDFVVENVLRDCVNHYNST